MGGVLVLGYVWVESGLWLGERNKWLVAGLMFLMGLGLHPRGILVQLQNARALGLFLLVSYGLAPLVAYGVAWLFFREQQPLMSGLIIMGATATTLSSSIVWTRLAGGNDALALVMSILGNSLQALATPVWLALLLGAEVDLPVGEMMYVLFQIVVLPMLASQVIVGVLGERALRTKPVTGVLARLLVLAVIWVAASKAADHLVTVEALTSSLAVVGVHIVLLAASWWVAGRLLPHREDRIALLFCSSQKTIPSSTHIASTYFPAGTTLPVLLYHFWQLLVDGVLQERLAPRKPTPSETAEMVAGDG